MSDPVAVHIVKMPEGVYIGKSGKIIFDASEIAFIGLFRGLEIIIVGIVGIHIVDHMYGSNHKVKFIF